MDVEKTARVKDEFRELGRLHIAFMKTQMQNYGSSARVGLCLLYFGLFLAAFGVVRLLDGAVMQWVEGVAARVQFLSGGLMILLALVLFTVSALFLRKTKEVAGQIFHEIGEDIRWLRRML